MDKVIQFASEIENITLAENLVDEVSDRFAISADIYGNILVSLVEAVNNAIMHGNKLDATKYVEVGYCLEGSILKFMVRDQGQGFDPLCIPDPTIEENLEKPNGRGVFLMRNLADEVEFCRHGTEVYLTFNLV